MHDSFFFTPSIGFTISNDFSVYNCLWFTLGFQRNSQTNKHNEKTLSIVQPPSCNNAPTSCRGRLSDFLQFYSFRFHQHYLKITLSDQSVGELLPAPGGMSFCRPGLSFSSIGDCRFFTMIIGMESHSKYRNIVLYHFLFPPTPQIWLPS